MNSPLPLYHSDNAYSVLQCYRYLTKGYSATLVWDRPTEYSTARRYRAGSNDIDFYWKNHIVGKTI